MDAAPTRRVGLVCPRCDAASAFECAEGWAEVTCPLCRDRFRALLATVRTKQARTDRQARDYKVRVKYAGREELVTFEGGADDIEMKSGDRVVFGYRRDTLYVVQNITLGTITRLRRVQSGVALTIAGIAVATCVVAIRSVARG